MASNLLIGFLLGAGSSAWVFAKMMRSTGGNTQNALIVAGVTGVMVWVTAILLLGTFLPA